MKKPKDTRGKRSKAGQAKDLPVKGRTVSGGAEAQAFTSVSNVLKTRHDTAKNSISNVR
jgi:hypothetical protein